MYLVIVRDDIGESAWVTHAPDGVSAHDEVVKLFTRANPNRRVDQTITYDIGLKQDTYVLYYTC